MFCGETVGFWVYVTSEASHEWGLEWARVPFSYLFSPSSERNYRPQAESLRQFSHSFTRQAQYHWVSKCGIVFSSRDLSSKTFTYFATGYNTGECNKHFSVWIVLWSDHPSCLIHLSQVFSSRWLQGQAFSVDYFFRFRSKNDFRFVKRNATISCHWTWCSIFQNPDLTSRVRPQSTLCIELTDFCE